MTGYRFTRRPTNSCMGIKVSRFKCVFTKWFIYIFGSSEKKTVPHAMVLNRIFDQKLLPARLKILSLGMLIVGIDFQLFGIPVDLIIFSVYHYLGISVFRHILKIPPILYPGYRRYNKGLWKSKWKTIIIAIIVLTHYQFNIKYRLPSTRWPRILKFGQFLSTKNYRIDELQYDDVMFLLNF